MDGDPTTAQKWDRAASAPLNMTIPYPAAGFVTHTFQFYGIDQAGNREAMQTVTIEQHAPDNIPPITFFDVTSPYIGDAVIHLNAVDNAEGMGLRDTWYQLDGGVWTQSLANPTVVTVAAPPVGAAGQAHTLSFYSRDNSPLINKEDTQTVEFVVLPLETNDTTPPVTVSDIPAPIPPAIYPNYNGPAVIHLTSTDEGGVAAVHWSLDGGADQTGTIINVPSPLSGQDLHAISYYAIDRAGNVEAPKMERFTVSPENIPPTTAAHNNALYTGPAIFELTAQDNVGGSGLLYTYYQVDDGPSIQNTPTPTGLTLATVTGEGLHTVYFWSVDRVGNKEATQTTTLRIDTIPPHSTSDATGTYVGRAPVRDGLRFGCRVHPLDGRSQGLRPDDEPHPHRPGPQQDRLLGGRRRG
jgi:hypothetical protein